jgi:rfaE bifunctional protein nucleotidyltransferase chain/domain
MSDSKTALVHGVFDVLHVGHLKLIEEAAKLGTVVLSITADEYVGKGPGRPINSHEDRARVLSQLRDVRHVLVSYHRSATGIIDDIRPDFYVKGIEYESEDVAGNFDAERLAVESHGGKVVFVDTGEDTRSSSAIINRHQPTITAEAHRWVRAKNLSWDLVGSWLRTASAKSVTVAGEVIRDEYVYVVPHGKSPKEAVITWTQDREVDSEEWMGGSFVVAQHAHAAGADTFKLVGDMANPVVKRRWVHRPFTQKVFSFVEMPSLSPLEYVEGEVVIVADFGHGMFPNSTLSVDAKFKAITVQSNSMNWGMNRINKWSNTRWDYLACDLAELSLAVPDADSLEEAITVMQTRLNAPHAVVTRGHRGAVYSDRQKLYEVPAFTDRAIDRIGAGDAFLGSTSSLIAAGAPVEVVQFVGSCAAALHVQTAGNAVAPRNELYGYMKAVLA